MKWVHGHPQTWDSGLKYHGGQIHYISESGLRYSNFKIQGCRIIMLQHTSAVICFLVHSELPRHDQVIHQCIKQAENCELCMKDCFALMFCWMCMFVQCALKSCTNSLSWLGVGLWNIWGYCVVWKHSQQRHDDGKNTASTV